MVYKATDESDRGGFAPLAQFMGEGKLLFKMGN
jgi:hypothetical protein